MPSDDEQGRPIHLELCAACDADKPAVGALIRVPADMPSGTRRAAAGPQVTRLRGKPDGSARLRRWARPLPGCGGMSVCWRSVSRGS
ncbi:hypothetical protein [Streptomyces ipomoeae]|uniref:hypothetical protein n=1 Tax=Streptomyces ipomoeae TaxID=103232 RepID=UPI001C6819D6